MLNAYKEYKVQLQILSIKSPQKQLILKAPEHLWNLDILFKVFPSARIVMTHRDPLQSIISYSSMISMFRRTAYKKTNFKDLGPYVTDVFGEGLKRSYKVRKSQNVNKNIMQTIGDWAGSANKSLARSASPLFPKNNIIKNSLSNC